MKGARTNEGKASSDSSVSTQHILWRNKRRMGMGRRRNDLGSCHKGAVNSQDRAYARSQEKAKNSLISGGKG